MTPASLDRTPDVDGAGRGHCPNDRTRAMLDTMVCFLRTAGMILLLGGMSPALAGIAWMESQLPDGGPKRLHPPPESHGRKAPAPR